MLENNSHGFTFGCAETERKGDDGGKKQGSVYRYEIADYALFRKLGPLLVKVARARWLSLLWHNTA